MIDSIYILASAVVVAEALNKLERCQPTARGLAPKQRVIEVLKAVAWGLLACGAGGVIVNWIMPMPEHLLALAQAFTMAGVAVLIVRTRVKEG